MIGNDECYASYNKYTLLDLRTSCHLAFSQLIVSSGCGGGDDSFQMMSTIFSDNCFLQYD